MLVYEFALPDSYVPWPGRTLLERTFVLLDLGVSFPNPCWVRQLEPVANSPDPIERIGFACEFMLRRVLALPEMDAPVYTLRL